MTANSSPSRALAAAAGLVIIALTAAAFWLSYAHLAEVASAHGLQNSPVRAWAWPATLDLFIVAGELLMLRAALAKQVDPWAIGLTTVGSLGSIVLNVAGVTGTRDPGAVPLLDYVVAAVPPTAALLAFGALMRQVHQALAGAAEPHPEALEEGTRAATSVTSATLERTPVEVSPEVAAVTPRAIERPDRNPQVICGAHQVWNLGTTPRVVAEEVAAEPRSEAGAEDAPDATRLPTEAAAAVIRDGWRTGASVAETARRATRSEAFVRRTYRALDDDRGAQQVPGQLSLVAKEVSA